MNSRSETLGSDVNMDDDGSDGLRGEIETVRGGEGDHFVRAGDDGGKAVRVLSLAFDHGFEDTWSNGS